MFAAGDGNARAAFQFCVAVDVVGDDRLFEPAEIEGFEQREHAFGVVESPAHVGVGHDVDAIADGFANGLHEGDIFLHARGAVGGAPAEAQLHGAVAFFFVTLSFGGELAEFDAVEAAGVDGDARFGAAAEQTEDRLLGGFAEEIPERDVHGGDGDHADAFAAEGHRLAVHVLPEKFDVPGIGADQQRLEVEVDHLLGDWWREGGVADADEAVVGENFDDQPAVKCEGLHGGFGKREEVHGISAEMRRQGNRLAAPADCSCANFFNFHGAPS